MLDNVWHCFNITDGPHIRTMKPQILANIVLEGLGQARLQIDSTRFNTFRGTKELSFRNKHVYDHMLMITDSHMHAIIIEL